MIARAQQLTPLKNRRDWMRIATWGFVVTVTYWCTLANGLAGDRYANLPTEMYLGAAEIVATVQTPKFFTEGPAADAHGDLYFTKDMLLAVGDRYEQEIAAHRESDARYR